MFKVKVVLRKSTKSNFKKSSSSCETRNQPGSKYTKFNPVRLAVVEKSRGETDKVRS